MNRLQNDFKTNRMPELITEPLFKQQITNRQVESRRTFWTKNRHNILTAVAANLLILFAFFVVLTCLPVLVNHFKQEKVTFQFDSLDGWKRCELSFNPCENEGSCWIRHANDTVDVICNCSKLFKGRYCEVYSISHES